MDLILGYIFTWILNYLITKYLYNVKNKYFYIVFSLVQKDETSAAILHL